MRLDFPAQAPLTLICMRFRKALLFTALVSALSIYGLDCFAAVVPAQMAQCCKTMPCSHSKNCCKSQTHASSAFIVVSAAKLAFPSVVHAAAVSGHQSHLVDNAVPAFAASRCHAPPGPLIAASLLILRI